jgi:CYTH domain-containing protein
MLEIERKYLVRSMEFKKYATAKKRIVQGFLNTHPERTVRVRISGDEAFITVKGKSSSKGLSRFEWEHRIPLDEGQALLHLCEQPLLEKYRYWVPAGPHLFEVDEFLGANNGLMVAEVELQLEDDDVTVPAWVEQEVTGQKKYYNSQLTKNPYSTWKH